MQLYTAGSCRELQPRPIQLFENAVHAVSTQSLPRLGLPVSTQGTQPDMAASSRTAVWVKVLVPIPWCTWQLRHSDYGKEAGAGAKAYPIIEVWGLLPMDGHQNLSLLQSPRPANSLPTQLQF